MTKKSSKFKEGDYSLPMLDFLGEDILRESVKESNVTRNYDFFYDKIIHCGLTNSTK